jgi:hypothetical protein
MPESGPRRLGCAFANIHNRLGPASGQLSGLKKWRPAQTPAATGLIYDNGRKTVERLLKCFVDADVPAAYIRFLFAPGEP